MVLLILSIVLGIAGAMPEPGLQTEKGERNQKSFGLHTSLDGTAQLWANTSAVTTAGFFGNAAVLLAGVYLLTHTEEVSAFADRLLPVGQAKVETVQAEGVQEEENMFEKGQHIIGDTLNKFTDNINNVNKDLSKRKGGLFQLPSLENLMPKNLENPLIRLKEKLFPTESEDKILTLTPQPTKDPEPAQLDFEPNVFGDNFAENLAKQSWNYMQENEDTDAQSWTYNINKNAEFENYQDDSLPFLYDYESSYPSFRQHASTSKDNIVIEPLVPEMRETLYPPVKEEFPQEEKKSLSEEKAKLALHKAKLQEKKKKWAENFLMNFYKKQELEEQTKQKMQAALAPPSQAETLYGIQEDYYQEPQIDDYQKYEVDGFYDQNGFYEEGFRIGDDEVQAILDAQLSDFGSFGVRIPKTQEQLENEAIENNVKNTQVEEIMEDNEITTVSSEETTLLDEEETTFLDEEETTFAPQSDDEETSSDFISSKGDDVALNVDIVDKPTKKMKKVKKLKKTNE